LGTNLVELGFLELDQMAGYLSRVLEVPQATPQHFERATAEALDALGPALADVYTAVPLGFQEDGDEKILAVALAEPKNQQTLAKLSSQCGYPIRAYCAPELRLYYYLEKHYQLTRKARFVRAGTGKRGPDYLEDRRRSQPVHGVESPPAVLLVPHRRGDTQSDGLVVPETRMSFGQAKHRIDDARDRERIGEILVEFSVGRCGAGVLFILRDQNALGWRVYSVDGVGMEDAVEELSLGLGGSSALQVARDSGKPYRGSAPSAGKPVERRLWEATGSRREPDEMLVVPIEVKGEVVNLFYAHPLPGKRFDDELHQELIELCNHAGEAYERLLADAKIAPDA
jgi:hypothetical protein